MRKGRIDVLPLLTAAHPALAAEYEAAGRRLLQRGLLFVGGMVLLLVAIIWYFVS